MPSLVGAGGSWEGSRCPPRKWPWRGAMGSGHRRTLKHGLRRAVDLTNEYSARYKSDGKHGTRANTREHGYSAYHLGRQALLAQV